MPSHSTVFLNKRDMPTVLEILTTDAHRTVGQDRQTGLFRPLFGKASLALLSLPMLNSDIQAHDPPTWVVESRSISIGCEAHQSWWTSMRRVGMILCQRTSTKITRPPPPDTLHPKPSETEHDESHSPQTQSSSSCLSTQLSTSVILSWSPFLQQQGGLPTWHGYRKSSQ